MSIAQQLIPIYNTSVQHKNKTNGALMWLSSSDTWIANGQQDNDKFPLLENRDANLSPNCAESYKIKTFQAGPIYQSFKIRPKLSYNVLKTDLKKSHIRLI